MYIYNIYIYIYIYICIYIFSLLTLQHKKELAIGLPPYKKNPAKKRYSEKWLQDHEQGDLTLLLNEKVDVGSVSS